MAKVNVLTTVFDEKRGWVLSPQYTDTIAAVDDRVRLTVAHTTDERLAALPETEVIFGRVPAGEDLQAAVKLKWVQLPWVGADSVLKADVASTDIILTTAAGSSSVQISEHVFALMLMFARRMHEYQAAQGDGRWDREASERVDELFEKTLGIVGLGSIGKEVARKAKVFGMRVVATKRTLDKAAVPDVDELLPHDRLDDLLSQSDYVLLAVPLTSETTGLVGARQLARMKPTAFLVNVCRGPVLDENALTEALHEGRLGGAGLDTFVAEPLPAESPLWRLPNVIITPHTAGATPRYWQRTTALFCDNLLRYLDGNPLRNVVQRDRGY